jgi:diguanylate cyclase (GGDEF)-like protein
VAKEEAQSDSSSRLRILIVDDVPTNIRVLGPVLREAGYQVYVARDGMQALTMVGEISPDLILLDVMMPGMDGFETCRQLKIMPESRDIPVIFLTARIEDQDVMQGFEVGAVDYVTKPFNAAILLARVKTHLTLRQQAKKLQSLADRDGLTMIANRRRLEEFLAKEWRRCQRNHLPLALIMLDIDYFKPYNDSYGHLRGDEALKQVAETINQAAQRPSDLAARYGGEEFALILGETRLDGAQEIAERLRDSIETLAIPHNASLVAPIVTISLGVACAVPGQDLDNANALIDAADTALYRAKAGGRNQVKVSTVPAL